MKKKILLTLLTVTMCTAVLTGCGQNVAENKNPAISKETPDVPKEVANAFDEAEKTSTADKNTTNLDNLDVSSDLQEEGAVITSRTGQYGINSDNPSKYNYYCGEFKIEKIGENSETYVVDYVYKIENGVGNGSITVYRLGETFVYEINKEYDCLLEKDNILAKITKYKTSDENEMLFNTVKTLYEECLESEKLSDYSLDDIEYMYSEEGIEEAHKLQICVD